MRKIFSLGLGALAVAALAMIGSAQARNPNARGGEPDAQAENINVGVIVHTAKPYGAVIAAIEDLGGTVTAEFENIDGLAAEIPFDAFAALSSIEGLEAVEKDMVVNLPKPNESVPAVADLFSAPQTDTRRKGKPQEESEPQVLELLDANAVSELIGSNPESYYSYLSIATGAADTWVDTQAGASSIVAVIDTGTWAGHPCLAGRVIAGPDFSTDAGTGFEGSTLSTNHWHGTFVGGVVANDCAIVVPATHPIAVHLPADAQMDYGGGLSLIPVLGMAPASSIYAVKVFPHTGAGVATSTIIAAIDHVISAKISGAVDIDVLNMSLGGATLFDGRSLEEQVVDAATDAGITVVISSGNEGPTPGSVARPGTAYTAVTVAAGTDEVHTRIFWDLVFGPGAGKRMYPVDERGVSDFSNRGPSADNRNAVDIIATGVFNFSGFTPSAGAGLLNWASGTSFSAPTVAGAAALLASWKNINGVSVSPTEIKNALTAGAVSIGDDWPFHAQGHGWVQVANSLDLLKSGKTNSGERHDLSDPMTANILQGGEDTHTETITLRRGRTTDFLLTIDENTTEVTVTVNPVTVNPGGQIDPGQGPIPNSWELYIKSAKHGGTGSLVDTANIFGVASVTIGDGTISTSGAIGGGLIAPAPMEPGLMKVTLEPDWTNDVHELTATITITRTQGDNTSNAGGNTLTIGQDGFDVFAFFVPAGTDTATLDLSWSHDWSKDATNDLDIIVLSPGGALFFAGATLNAPERQIINSPEEGLWLVAVSGFTVNRGRDPYRLDVSLD